MMSLDLMYKAADIAENVGGLLSLLEGWGHDVSDLKQQPTRLKVYRANHVQRQLAYISRLRQKAPEAVRERERLASKRKREKLREQLGENAYRLKMQEISLKSKQKFIDTYGIEAYREKTRAAAKAYYYRRKRKAAVIAMLQPYAQKYEETQDEYYKLMIETIYGAYEQGRRDAARLRELERRVPLTA